MQKKRAILATLLLVPVPSLAVIMAFAVFPDSLTGRLFYGAGKVWILALPAFWIYRYSNIKTVWGKSTTSSLRSGILSGIALSLAIILGYISFGSSLIDIPQMRAGITKLGFTANSYIALVVYLSLINSLLEEIIWRWFIAEQMTQLTSSHKKAALISGVCFTLHHTVALSFYLDWAGVLVASAGVFAAGVVWSWQYLKHRSILAVWISHILADIAVFTLGYYILFSNGEQLVA